jgi:hypothetical protein
MTVVDGDVLKCTVEISAPDSVVMNMVYHYQLSDPTPDSPSDLQILTALDNEMTEIYGSWDDEMADEYTIEEGQVARVEWDAVDGVWEIVEDIGEFLINIPGLAISPSVPHGVAACITFPTDKPKTRGRKYFPGAANDGITESSWIAAVLTVLGTIGASILSDRTVLGSAVLVPVVASITGLPEPLLIASVNAISAYQRRRKPGVGS